MVTASRTALARMALTAVPLSRALALAQWTGAGRELTTSGVLRPALAVEACRMLGIDVPSGKLRSAKDVPELDQTWTVALAADLVLVSANRVSAAPGVAELVAMANRTDETAELDDDLTERVVLAWLRGAGTALGFPADACGECLTVLHELSEANGPMELTDLVAAVLDADGSAPVDLDLDVDRMDLADHAVTAVYDLADFEALATGPGRSAGGTVTLTPLGRLLSEAVFGSISPPAAVTAEDLVTALAWPASTPACTAPPSAEDQNRLGAAPFE